MIGGEEMTVAVIGSRDRCIDCFEDYLPDGVDTIISGGARGIDSCAASYARANGLRLIEFLPDYDAFGRSAPLKRNIQIVDAADFVLAFWDGTSRGTKYVIDYCKRINKPFRIEYI